MTEIIMKKNTDTESEIDLLEVFSVLFDSRWLIIGVSALFTMIGFFIAYSSEPIYKADALIQVEKKESAAMMLGMKGDSSLLPLASEAEIEIFKSRMILGKTVDKFDLMTEVQPDYSSFFGKRLARIFKNEISASVRYFNVPSNVESAFHTLLISKVKNTDYRLQNSEGKTLLEGRFGEPVEMNGYQIFVENVNATKGDSFTLKSRTYLDAIAWLLSKIHFNEKGNNSGIFQISFEGPIPSENKEILDDIIQNYLIQNIERNSAEAAKSLVFLNKAIPEVKKNLTVAEDTLNQYRQTNSSVNLNFEAKSILDVMVKIEEELKSLELKENEMTVRYTSEHPVYKTLLENRNALIKEKDRLGSLGHKLPKTQREILRLTRDVDVNQNIYILLLNKIEELRIVKASTIGNVRILDKAESHSAPIKPNKTIIVFISMLLGGMLSVIYVIFIKYLRQGIENQKDLEDLGVPVYASVPFSKFQLNLENNMKKNKRMAIKDTLLVEASPHDVSIEALRSLRTNVQFLMMKSKNNILMISGSTSGLGKSFTAANISAVIADAGINVLLIDADMRKGTIAKFFALKNESGLSDILAGKCPFEEKIKATHTSYLNVVTRGTVPINPSELLIHPRFGEFLQWASTNYDLVVIDTPPILAVTDASIVGKYAGITLLLARFSKTKIKDLEFSCRRFANAGIHVDGFILNGIQTRMNNDYKEYYSYK